MVKGAKVGNGLVVNYGGLRINVTSSYGNYLSYLKSEPVTTFLKAQ